MKRHLVLVLCATMVVFRIAGNASGEDKILKMSTTTSTQASGLLDVLLPALEKDTGIRIKVFAKGTGAAIRDGMDGNVDVIFVHARSREERFIADGFGTKRYGVMHNDFVILGPPDDPARVGGTKTAADALKKIAAAEALFVSRGDDSGTHTREQILWKSTGLAMDTVSSTIVKKGKKTEVSYVQPQGAKKWYLSIGQGMGKAITLAEEKRAYILADRGTYIKYKHGRSTGLDLDILCQGDAVLANPYGVIPIDPEKFPHVKYDLAKQFAEWLVSPKGQSVIDNYRLLGKQLFYPDAIKMASQD